MRYVPLVVLTLATATGCAAVQTAETRSTERMLAAAGFHAQVADTPERVADLESLPARQVVLRRENGAVSYVFADPAGCHCVYVGGEREHREYQRLRLEEQRADEKSLNCWGWPWCTGYGG
jgi:hypothetical protein